MRKQFSLTAIIGALAVPAWGQTGSFVHWESPHVHPLDITSDGSRLLAVSTPDNRLMVFDLTVSPPSLIAAIPVGLEPVSVRAHGNDEAWVVNAVSDSVSVVSLSGRNVIATLSAGDEPADVVFAGFPEKAFVSVGALNQIWAFDPENLGSAPIVIPIVGNQPRALATDGGTTLYAAIFESGNKTSIVRGVTVSSAANPYPGRPNPPPNSGSVFFPELAPADPAPPASSLIVRKNADGTWRDGNGANWSLGLISNPADNDVAIIDASALSVTYAKGLMNIDMAIALRNVPDTGSGPGTEITTVGSEATNEIRFEPNVQSLFIHHVLGKFNGATPATTSRIDLNPHLDYVSRSIPLADRQESVADTRGITWLADGSAAFISSMGTDSVIAISPTGARLARADVGQGPTGVVLDEPRQQLYVLNKFESSISVMVLSPLAEVSRVYFYDPTPASISSGRQFLYNARNFSGLGQASCASCHVDARWDELAWDLGEPASPMSPFSGNCNFGNGGCEDWHPVKGPLTTQSLIDIVGKEPLHWRGDRTNLAAFAPAYMTLQAADSQPSPAAMTRFQNFLASISNAPQPNRTFFNGLPATMPNGGNPSNGQTLFNNSPITQGSQTCVSCHNSASGFQNMLIPANQLGGTQSMKVVNLRNLYRKTGFSQTGQNNTRGFGFTHDGSFDSVFNFLRASIFRFPAGATGDQQRRDLEAFCLCFDSGTHPAIGVQTTLVSQATATPAQLQLITNMLTVADSGSVGLIVKGIQGGVQRGYAYIGGGSFQSDIHTEVVSSSALLAAAASGSELTFTVVPAGSSVRLGIDRDLDGYYDRDEILAGSDPADPASTPAPPPPPPCPTDFNADHVTNTIDLGILLAHFGASVTPGTNGDTNNDGVVNTLDLGALLAAFGSNCPT